MFRASVLCAFAPLCLRAFVRILLCFTRLALAFVGGRDQYAGLQAHKVFGEFFAVGGIA